MTNKDLFSALGGINPAWIEDAAPKHKTKKTPVFLAIFLPTAATAAAAILVFFLLIFPKLYPRISPTVPPADSPMQEPSINQSAPLPDGNFTELTAELTEHTALNGVISVEEGKKPENDSFDLPWVYFRSEGFVLTVKAIEELPHVYRTLNRYGSIYHIEYRIYKMQVLDSLKSGITGQFYYALPANLQGDLRDYDTLLLSMKQIGHDVVLLNTETNTLTSFNIIFDACGEAELGNVIAFNNGIFDETLWQDKSWIYGYQFAEGMLERNERTEDILVKRGGTLKQAITVFFERWENSDREYTPPELNIPTFTHPESQKAAEYVKPFTNGTFVYEFDGINHTYRRYINGFPTNERMIISQNGNHYEQKNPFTQDEIASLPDLSAYLATFDLTSLHPQHTDPAGKKLWYKSVGGWYEKTDKGIYSILRVVWIYTGEKDSWTQYFDESFFLLTEEGAKLISREDLINLIGENQNISHYKYGTSATVVPIC